MQDIRALLNKYPGAVSLGEISSEDSLATMAQYTQGDYKLHMGYSFELLTDDDLVNTLEQQCKRLSSK